MSGREESIGRWISILYRIGQVYVSKKLESLQIGRGQHAFLTVLFYQEGISQRELARILNMDKGSVAHALQKLEKAGFVERKRDQVDRRINLVYLTEKARGVESRLFSVLASWTGKLADGFSDEERRYTLTLLRRMAENAARALEQKKEGPVS